MRLRRGRRRPRSRCRAGRTGRAGTHRSSAGASPADSDSRVAHAGNGNSTASGTGISGCETNIVPGLARVARMRCDGRQEPVLRTPRLGRVQPADHLDRRVGDDPPLHLGRRLLRADEDDAQRTTALGDVEQHLLDRARPLARRVLVQLVDHREQQPARARRLLARRLGREHDAHHEALGALGEVVQVDDRDLPALGGHPPRRGVRQVTAHDAAQRLQRRTQSPQEGVDRAGAGDRARPVAAGLVVAEAFGDELDQRVVGAQDLALDRHRAVADRRGLPTQARRHRVDHHRVLVAFVLGVGEDVGQQLADAELGEGPPERGDAAGAAGDERAAARVVRGRRRVEAHRGERARGQPQLGVVGGQVRRRGGGCGGRGTAGPRPSR